LAWAGAGWPLAWPGHVGISAAARDSAGDVGRARDSRPSPVLWRATAAGPIELLEVCWRAAAWLPLWPSGLAWLRAARTGGSLEQVEPGTAGWCCRCKPAALGTSLLLWPPLSAWSAHRSSPRFSLGRVTGVLASLPWFWGLLGLDPSGTCSLTDFSLRPGLLPGSGPIGSLPFPAGAWALAGGSPAAGCQASAVTPGG